MGKPHLKRAKKREENKEIKAFKQLIRKRMPQRHLLDILKDTEYWVNYTRHFGPLSGSDPKLTDPALRYIFTVFGYGCNLGPSQTARHAREEITLRVLKRINDQHISAFKLEASLRDIIEEYTRFELPFIWGKGNVAIADGTHVELLENNLMGERHIRYGGYGGIAYHHISDTYIALFSHFIACGVYEAVYILDGLLKNTSVLKTDMMQVALSIQAGKVLPSMLLQKLGTHARKNKLYKAFRELGRAVRTLYLLKFISDKPLRMGVIAANTKIESFNAFGDWISFGGHIIPTGDPVEQEKRIKYMNLIANAVMLQNVVDLSEICEKLTEEGYEITQEKLESLSPYMTEHIKRFGYYVVDIDKRPKPLIPRKIFFARAS